jgi:hypothetical protein
MYLAKMSCYTNDLRKVPDRKLAQRLPSVHSGSHATTTHLLQSGAECPPGFQLDFA